MVKKKQAFALEKLILPFLCAQPFATKSRRDYRARRTRLSVPTFGKVAKECTTGVSDALGRIIKLRVAHFLNLGG